MNKKVSKIELIKESQIKFGDYGQILLMKIVENISEYSYRNQTDWNYSSCFSFDFILNKEIPYWNMNNSEFIKLLKLANRTIYKVLFDISATQNYYLYYFISHKLIDNNTKIKSICKSNQFKDEHLILVELIENILIENDFKNFNNEILDLKKNKMIKNNEIKNLYNNLFHEDIDYQTSYEFEFIEEIKS